MGLRRRSNSWNILVPGSWWNGALPSDRRIVGSCRSKMARICSNHHPEDSPSCPVGVHPPYDLYPTPPSCPPVNCLRNWRQTWCGPWHCHLTPVHQEIMQVTRSGTSTEPSFYVHFPGMSGSGLYSRTVFLRCFWSGVGFLARPCKPCPPPSDEFHSWFS